MIYSAAQDAELLAPRLYSYALMIYLFHIGYA